MVTAWSQGFALIGFCSLDKGMLVVSRGQQEPDRVDQLVAGIRTAYRRQVAWVSAMCGVAGGGASYLATGFWWVGVTVLLTTGLTAMSEWRAASVMARGMWRIYCLYRLVQPVTYAAVIVIIAAFAADRPQNLLLALMVSSYALSAALGLLVLASRNEWQSAPPVDAATRKQVWRFALRYHSATAATLVAARLDVLLAPVVMPFADVGLYAVAVAPGVVLAAVGSTGLLRALSGGPDQGFPVVPLLVVVGAVAAGCLAAPFVIPFAFGTAFSSSVGPARVLLIAGALAYVSQWLTGRMAVRGLPALASIPQIGTALAITLAAALVPTLLGFSIAVLIGRCIAVVVGSAILMIAGTNGTAGGSKVDPTSGRKVDVDHQD